MEAIKAFRRIFINNVTNGVYDPLYHSTTLASLCMNIYRTMFLSEGQIGIVPEKVGATIY